MWTIEYETCTDLGDQVLLQCITDGQRAFLCDTSYNAAWLRDKLNLINLDNNKPV
jgi:hypothetical protein